MKIEIVTSKKVATIIARVYAARMAAAAQKLSEAVHSKTLAEYQDAIESNFPVMLNAAWNKVGECISRVKFAVREDELDSSLWLDAYTRACSLLTHVSEDFDLADVMAIFRTNNEFREVSIPKYSSYLDEDGTDIYANAYADMPSNYSDEHVGAIYRLLLDPKQSLKKPRKTVVFDGYLGEMIRENCDPIWMFALKTIHFARNKSLEQSIEKMMALETDYYQLTKDEPAVLPIQWDIARVLENVIRRTTYEILFAINGLDQQSGSLSRFEEELAAALEAQKQKAEAKSRKSVLESFENEADLLAAFRAQREASQKSDK